LNRGNLKNNAQKLPYNLTFIHKEEINCRKRGVLFPCKTERNGYCRKSSGSYTDFYAQLGIAICEGYSLLYFKHQTVWCRL